MYKIMQFILILAIYSSVFAKDSLVFAPLPMEDTKTIFTQFDPMVKFLEKKLKKKIILDYNQNYADILKKFQENKIDLAYLGPLPYIKLKEKYILATPLVHFKSRNGNAFYTCSLISTSNTNIEIKDIKNKKIALTQPLSTCGYLSVNTLLKKEKSLLENNKYQYLGRHDSVALSVIRREFDFGGVKSSIAKKYTNLGLKELAKTPLLPSFSLIGNKATIQSDTLNQIIKIMKNIKKEETQYWGENIKYGCIEAKNSDFNNLRMLYYNTSIPNKGNF